MAARAPVRRRYLIAYCQANELTSLAEVFHYRDDGTPARGYGGAVIEGAHGKLPRPHRATVNTNTGEALVSSFVTVDGYTALGKRKIRTSSPFRGAE